MLIMLFIQPLFLGLAVSSALRFPIIRALSRLKCLVEERDAASAPSLLEEKNQILLKKLENPIDGNMTAVASEYVNFCDESFDKFLNEKIDQLPTEKEKQVYGRIRYEVNSARQRKLRDADQVLRGVLSSGGLKQMEAKLIYHLRRAEIDMAFRVILQLNIEDAIRANSTVAVQVMTHLETMINEYQDTIVSPPVRLLRLLMRTDEENIRKQMLRQKLILEESNFSSVPRSDCGAVVPEAKPTLSPQCEHIIVSAVESWGGADVIITDLEDTIDDVLSQIREEKQDEMEKRCADILQEIAEVRTEYAMREHGMSGFCPDKDN